MQNDTTIWETIGHGGCCFMKPVLTDRFCTNPYNVAGLCGRHFCPLANGYYATVREHGGECYLYMKTVEKAHLPKEMWDMIKLSENNEEAEKQIDQNLRHIYRDIYVTRCKARLKRLREVLVRARWLKLNPDGTKLTTLNKKVERRERTREAKAEIAARLETSIESELLERLKQGVYGSLYQIPGEVEEESEDEEEAESEEEEELELEGRGELSFMEAEEDETDDLTSSEEDDDDIEGPQITPLREGQKKGDRTRHFRKTAAPILPPVSRIKAKEPRVVIEYEDEGESSRHLELV